MLGKELKRIINEHIKDEDLVCLGEQGDKFGRYDRKIIGIETRQVGFDNNDVYKIIVSYPFESQGNMKFWS